MSEHLRNCRNCHWWIANEHVNDNGRCRRFPPAVVPDYTIKKVAMMSGKSKTLIDSFTGDQYGVFPMTGGSTWCGEWTEQRHNERQLLQQDEKERERKIEEFETRNPEASRRLIP